MINKIEKSEKLKTIYQSWKKLNIEKIGFFILFNTFLEDGFLSRLSGGAVKMYMYLGIVSKNATGESFHSIESMSKYFRVSKRTISKWIVELEKANLIFRMQHEINGVSYTYLMPY